MMKKLLLFGTALMAFSHGVRSQNTVSLKTDKSPITTPNANVNHGSKVAYAKNVVTDTLHYYFNKQLYKIPNVSVTGYPYYKSPASTGTAVTHVGSVFLNSDTLKINGLEVRASKNDGSGFNSNVPGRLYLCNVNAQNIPVLPPIDSVNFSVGNAHPMTGNPKGWSVGGNFGSLANPINHTLTGNFAILARNTSTTQGDTIRILRTAAITLTNTTGNQNNKFGEGLGVVRFGGVIQKTTNFSTAPGFGNGTDYEFCVAPRVTYTLIADHRAPARVDNLISNPSDSIACWEQLTFTNTSSSQYTNRFFNLNQFYLKWAPFVSTPPGNFSGDSAISWNFDDDPITAPGTRPSIFLHYGASTITKWYDTAGVFGNCVFKARLRKMSAESGPSMVFVSDSMFKVVVMSCGEKNAIDERAFLSNLKVYPNPLVNGKTNISGLSGQNTILVYNMIGQLVSSEITDKETVMVDLLKQPQGNFMIRVINARGSSKVVKVINQKE